jgi:hypothetical protein
MGPARKQTTSPKGETPVRRTRKKAAAPEATPAPESGQDEQISRSSLGAVAALAGTVATQAAPSRRPTREQIAQRAFEIYQSRGGGHGRDLDDWLRAEQELALSAARR